MMGRPLMTVDELKSMPKGKFIVMKTGTHPLISKLKLYFKWGIKFGEPFLLPDKAARSVTYMERDELMREVAVKYPPAKKSIPIPVDMTFEEADIPQENKKANLKTEKRS